MQRAFVLGALLLGGATLAQESANFKLSEHVFNSGGHPRDGTTPSSASYKISLDAVGDGLTPMSLGSASFHVDVGFAWSYPPPGEVGGLQFADKETLTWAGERSVGVYHLYRDRISNVFGVDFATCQREALTTPTFVDSDPPPAANGYFYLVTAENRLDEEGTKGFQSDGTERLNAAPCP